MVVSSIYLLLELQQFYMILCDFNSDSFNAHQESMRQMMRSFSEPFGRDLLSISDGRGRAHTRTGRDDGENSLTVSLLF